MVDSIDYHSFELTKEQITNILENFQPIAPWQNAQTLHGIADLMVSAGDYRLKTSLVRSGVERWQHQAVVSELG